MQAPVAAPATAALACVADGTLAVNQQSEMGRILHMTLLAAATHPVIPATQAFSQARSAGVATQEAPEGYRRRKNCTACNSGC